ncbi:MAG TPA: DUF2357 domain-containing protein [Clostridiaceae bacterium]|nr:DUF2357 domain-containing protein [Clostridiaceae bacterium]
MASLPTGSKGDLIFIETELFKIHVRGKYGNKKSDAISANMNIEAYIEVNYAGEDEPVIKTLTSTGELGVTKGYKMMPCFYEEGIYEMLLINKDNKSRTIHHDSTEIKNNFTTAENITFGSFSFDGEIGYSTFQIISDNRIILTLTIEVFPVKMDYRRDYINMINDVNEEIASLAFEFMGKTYQSARLVDTNYQSASEFYHILEKIYNKFNDAIKRIERFPKHSVVTNERIQSVDRAKYISRNNNAYLRKHPEVLYRSDKGIDINGKKYMPQYLLEIKKETTVDIFENRFVKYIIKTVLKRIRVIKERVTKGYGENNPYYNVLCRYDKELSAHLNKFFSNVGELQGRKSMSLVFQMAPGYKEVYYYFMLLKKGLALSDDLYTITPKKMWKLYEIWCYIKLHNILRSLGYEVVRYGIIKAKDNGLYLTLVQDDSATMEYRNSKNDLLELSYNHTYSHKQTTTTEQRPDTVLTIRRKDKEEERIYIFDAKYRFDVEKDGTIGPMEDDINAMHRYRDAIVSQLNSGLQFKYDTIGAYVMFPYADEEKFKNHRFYKSIETVNIGALPMLPGSTVLMEEHLKELLMQSEFDAEKKVVTYSKYDNFGKFKHKNVMIANARDDEHLQTYIKHGFYHIPVETLAHIRPEIEYIALYLPKAGINYYGRVKSYSTYLRKECKELPKNSEEEYIRFELEDIKLIGPISIVEYGVRTVMYTTLYLLENAENMHELNLNSREEIILYRKLRKLSKIYRWKLRKRSNGYILNDIIVELLDNGKLRINGKKYRYKEGIEYLDTISNFAEELQNGN